MAHPTRIFHKAEEMKEAWDKYKVVLKEESKNWPKVQYVGKDGVRKEDYPIVPYTLEGFKRYCRDHYGEVEQYFGNQDKLYDNFIGICRAIREEIREHQIKGGLMGFYNPSITQRLNGLADKTQTEHTGSINIPKVPDIGDRG